MGQVSQLVWSSGNGYAIALKSRFQSALLVRSKSQIFKAQINISAKKRQLWRHLLKLCVWGHFHRLKKFGKLSTLSLSQ